MSPAGSLRNPKCHLDILGSKATPLAGTDLLILSLTPQRTLILFVNLKCFNVRHIKSYEKNMSTAISGKRTTRVIPPPVKIQQSSG